MHKQLDKLKRQSYEELISIRKERDDLVVKVKKIENELFRLKKKLRAANSEVSKSREMKSSSCNKTYDELRQDLHNARNSERRLKDELQAKESQFDDERAHMRDIVKREKSKLNKYQEDMLYAKDTYERHKNRIIKEMIEKDETIHQISNELNEIKSEVREKEILKVENKLSELKCSIDQSISNFDTNHNMQKVKTSRDFTRSKSPFMNDNNTSETVMYGGGTSVIDSMIGLFPGEKTSVTTSQEIDFKTQNKGKYNKHQLKYKPTLEDVEESVLHCDEVVKFDKNHTPNEFNKTSRNLSISKPFIIHTITIY